MKSKYSYFCGQFTYQDGRTGTNIAVQLPEMKQKTLQLAALIAALLLAAPQTYAQVLTAMRDSVKSAYSFWLYNPGLGSNVKTANEDGKLPLIVFLHGKSLSGTDMSKVRRYGPLDAIQYGRQIGAFIVAPQTSNGWTASKIDKIVDWVIRKYPVDSNRIYVIGMSMGGYGTIDYVGTHADRVAAAMAICGGGDLKDYTPLRSVPLWIIHGTSDTAVSIKESQKVIDGMKLSEVPESENRLIFTKLEGIDHSRPGRIFYMPQTYEWLFKHSLADSTRAVDRSFKLTVKSLDTAYEGQRSGLKPFLVVDRH